ncbi:hypothetical protein [Dinghuibacter silviterrae]|uniref:Carbohydrate binding protein with CBM9 domain n=1 Tax=Dinghuibacter silviterrae TaxID=1539049 RepID=A0A4R8DVW8_9BACT|nr:hypothetical protein [Dinghuibacter silviterrae]TDX02206.1 hypothetical protein EDB95_3259 [Dinghuibacter silviterrae]
MKIKMLTAAFGICLASACSPSHVMTQNEHALPIAPPNLVMDGKASDWKGIPFSLDPGTTMRYALANDSANLYLCLTSTNPSLEDKIFRMGLKVYLDTTGSRREATGIQFPMPVDGNALQAIAATSKGDSRVEAEKYHQFIRLQENQYETFGWASGNGLNAMGSQDMLTIGFTLDAEDILIYEIKIPLKSLYGDPVPPTAFTRPLSIGLYIDGIPRSEDPNAPIASEIGQPGANMTGARINVGRGGRLSTNPYSLQNEQLFKPQRAWIKCMLAKQ